MGHTQNRTGLLLDDIGMGWLERQQQHVALQSAARDFEAGDVAHDIGLPIEQAMARQKAMRAIYGVSGEIGRGEKTAKQHEGQSPRPIQPKGDG